MRRVLSIETGEHPDLPAPLTFHDIVVAERLLYQVYVNGRPFIGVPLGPTGPDVQAAAQRAIDIRDQLLDTGRYEYVDLRLVVDRRSGEQRRTKEEDPQSNGDRWYDKGRFGWYVPSDRREWAQTALEAAT